MLGRKIYRGVAQAILESDAFTTPITNPTSTDLDKGVLVNKLVFLFQQDNPLFDADKFREACTKGVS